MQPALALSSDPAPEPRSPWILNGWLDLAFVCGGLPWLLAATNALAQHAAWVRVTAALSVSTVVLTTVLSNPHTMATLVRIYWTPEARERFHVYARTLVLPCVALCAVGFVVQGAVPLMLLGYLVWVIQHYSSQCYGITLIYCYKRGYPLSATQKQLVRVLYQATAAVAIVRRFTWPDWGARVFLGYDNPSWTVPMPFLWAANAVFVVALAANLVLGVETVRDTGRTPPLPALVLTGSTLAFLLLSGWFSGLLALYVPAVFHGSQYLAVAASYHLKEGSTRPSHAGMWAALRSSTGAFYFLLLVLGGAFIYVGLPRVLEEMGMRFATAMASIFAVVNFHHFLTDRAIWRLRDPRTREILLA